MTETMTTRRTSLSSPILRSPSLNQLEVTTKNLSDRINTMAQAAHLVDLNVDLFSFVVDDVGCLPLQWLSTRYKRIHTNEVSSPTGRTPTGRTTLRVDVKRLAAEVGISTGHIKLLLGLSSNDDETLEKKLSELKVLTKCAKFLPRIRSSKLLERHAMTQYLCNHLLPAAGTAAAAGAVAGADSTVEDNTAVSWFYMKAPTNSWTFRSSKQWWAVTPTQFFKKPQDDGNDAYVFLGSFLTEYGEAKEAIFKCVPMMNTHRVNDLVNEYCAIDRLHRFHNTDYATRCIGRSHLSGDEELDKNAYDELANPQPCTTNLCKVPLHFTCGIHTNHSHNEEQQYAILVHPYYNGGTLSDSGVIGKHERKEICRQMCRALWQIHRANMTHGDVKTANFFLHRRNGPQRATEFTSVMRCSTGDSSDNMEQYKGLTVDPKNMTETCSTALNCVTYDHADAEFEVMLGDTESVETEGRVLKEYLAAKHNHENFRVQVRYTTAYRIAPGDEFVSSGKSLFRLLQHADLEGLALSILEVALDLSPTQWQDHVSNYADPLQIRQIIQSSEKRLRRIGFTDELLNVMRKVLKLEHDPFVLMESPQRITAESFLIAFEG